MDSKTITVLLGDFGPDRNSTPRFEATDWQIDGNHQLSIFNGREVVATFAPGWIAVYHSDAEATTT